MAFLSVSGFVLYFGGSRVGPHLEVLRADSWLGVQGSLLEGLWGSHVVAELNLVGHV